MRYKTIVRLALRVMGVYFLASAVVQAGHHLPTIMNLVNGAARGSTWLYIGTFGGIGARLLVGGYLLFGGRWLLNYMIPANRPYCHECGYDLSGSLMAGVCAECGTAHQFTRGPLDSTKKSDRADEKTPPLGDGEHSVARHLLAKKDKPVEDRARSDQSDNR